MPLRTNSAVALVAPAVMLEAAMMPKPIPIAPSTIYGSRRLPKMGNPSER